jgi:hypothetical protein
VREGSHSKKRSKGRGRITEWHGFPSAGAAKCRLPLVRKLILDQAGGSRIVPDYKQLVGEEENHVALLLRAIKPHTAGFKLECEVIAKGAVEPQLLVLDAVVKLSAQRCMDE